MKLLCLITSILFAFTVSAQKNQSVDSLSVLFKAKLFTVSEYGVSNKEQILKDIENQKGRFLKTKYKNFMFIKIDFDQMYRSGRYVISFNRPCSYYIAFNVVDSRYYRLGGFDNIDIDSFMKDLKRRETTVFDFDGNEIEDMDIYCLDNYYSLSRKKRLKKGFNCFANCVSRTETEVIVH
jgi:hypothetical protein